MKTNIKPYNKRDILRVLCRYHASRKPTVHTARALIFTKRFTHGTQFMLDLFIESEMYINHFPQVDMRAVRGDILYVLNQVPNYRIKYE